MITPASMSSVATLHTHPRPSQRSQLPIYGPIRPPMHLGQSIRHWHKPQALGTTSGSCHRPRSIQTAWASLAPQNSHIEDMSDCDSAPQGTSIARASSRAFWIARSMMRRIMYSISLPAAAWLRGAVTRKLSRGCAAGDGSSVLYRFDTEPLTRCLYLCTNLGVVAA